MHSLYLLGIHPDAMPCHGSYVVDSSCRFLIFFGILGYDSPATSSEKKKHILSFDINVLFQVL